MRHRWKQKRLELGIAGILCLALTVQAGEGFNQLTLQISTDRHNVLPLEPLPIIITLSNNTGKSVIGHTVITPNAGFLEFYVARGDQLFEHFSCPTYWPVSAMEKIEPTPLMPGHLGTVRGLLYHSHVLNSKKGRYLLPEPGDYRIKATLKDIDTDQTIESNILAIQAAQPVGQDAGAYDFQKELPDRCFLLGGGEAAKLEELILRFPESRYVRYAYYSLGMLEKAASYEDFFLAGKALARLIETSLKEGNLQKAEGYFATLKAKFPNSEWIKEAEHHIRNVRSDQ